MKIAPRLVPRPQSTTCAEVDVESPYAGDITARIPVVTLPCLPTLCASSTARLHRNDDALCLAGLARVVRRAGPFRLLAMPRLPRAYVLSPASMSGTACAALPFRDQRSIEW